MQELPADGVLGAGERANQTRCWHGIFRVLEQHYQGELRKCERCGHVFWHSYRLRK